MSTITSMPVYHYDGTSMATPAKRVEPTISSGYTGGDSVTVQEPINSAIRRDTVTISDEGRKMAAEREEPTAQNYWRKYLTGSANQQKNGITRTVKEDGDSIEIFEYKHGKLLKHIAGTYSESGVTIDTTVYDKRGEVSQTIHTSLNTTYEGQNAVSGAIMKRHVEWFSNGERSRSMDDTMQLHSQYRSMEGALAEMQEGGVTIEKLVKAAMEEQPETLEDLTGRLTLDYQKTDYMASIFEYQNGRLRRELDLTQKGSFVHETNRTGWRTGVMDDHTTNELFHEVQTALHVTEYDEEGQLARTASMSDQQTDTSKEGDGMQRQNFSVSWYNEGQLVKTGSGQMTMHESNSKHLMDRVTMLDALGVSEKAYASSRPDTATELLSRGLEDAATEADHFGSAMADHHLAESYNAAALIGEFGAGDSEYSLRWKTDTYVGGEKVATQIDEESAVRNPALHRNTFETGGGLTDDAMPTTLKRSTHVDQSFEKGQLVSEATLTASEYVDEKSNAPDMKYTHLTGTERHGSNTRTDERTVQGGLWDVDRDHSVASQGMGREMGLMLGDAFSMFGGMHVEQ